MERELPLMAVYELENGDFLYIQDCSEEEDFDYTICDSKGEEKDGGLWGYGHDSTLTHEVMCEFLVDNGYAPQYTYRPDLDLIVDTTKQYIGARED